MDARVPTGSSIRGDEDVRPPLFRFLERCHAEIAGDSTGTIADYIPELAKADPADFGVSVATTDGHVYEIGDSAVPFTIQSISKAFVFALAFTLRAGFFFGGERRGATARTRASSGPMTAPAKP